MLNKKIIGVVCGLGLSATYCYKKHLYEKELFNQYNYLLQNNVKLSGVYLQQRQAFGFLWYVHWLLPYHQSLKIVQKDGTIRHVGLGKSNNDPLDRHSEFTLHEGKHYEGLSDSELSIPIECWVDYKRKYGNFPSNINIESLNKITTTEKEKSEGDSVYKIKFGQPHRDQNGDFMMASCRSAVMHAIREEELIRQANE